MPALFFHVTQSAVEEVLQINLGRALDRGWRVEIRGTDAGRMAWLDDLLWRGPEEGFLPHGLAGGPQDDLQPVLLTLSPRPDSARPDSARPDSARPDSARPDSARPDSARPDSARLKGRQAIMTLDGAEVTAAEVAGAERVWIFFDGRDEAALRRAREQWKALTGAGASAQYWSEESGRWQMKAEK